MRKVLFVISYLDKGGAERALSNITTHFPKDWDIDILVNDDGVIDYPFRGNILTLGITDKPRTGSIRFQFKVLLKRVKRLKYLKKRGNYQACVSFLDSANIANILSGKKYCRVVVSVRTSLMQSAQLLQYKYIVNPLVRLLYNGSDKVVAASKGIAAELREIFSVRTEKISVIKNGYDLAEIKQRSREKLSAVEEDIVKDKLVLATMGRLSHPKGQWHLIRAFSEVIKQVPNAVLLMIGSGELEAYLKDLCQKCQLEDRVYFTGFVSNPYKYLNHADIFAFSSLYEGFPNALAEAVCLGLPCIATDFRAGAREILAPNMMERGQAIELMTEVEFGVLTPLCSGEKYESVDKPLEKAEKSLAEAMIMLAQDADKRKYYAQQSKQRSVSLGINEAVRKWIDVIEGKG